MFCQPRNPSCLQSADALRGKVAFCGEYAREHTTVCDRSNAAARHEIARKASTAGRSSSQQLE